MAKKKSSGRNDVVKVSAFIALVLSAFLFLAGGIFSGQVKSILELCGKIALLIAIAVPSYQFGKSHGKTWYIIYWIALVVYVLGCVFGVLQGFNIM